MATIGVTRGIGGWYAVLYDSNGPIQSGIGYYPTEDEAWEEAEDWAASDVHVLEQRNTEPREVKR